MRTGKLLLPLAAVLLLLGLNTASRAYAGSGPPPQSQTSFVTPTPGPDGRIVYTVKEGDALWTIAALSGKTLEELMALNGLQPGDYITPGMQLVLGFGGPAQPTAGPGAPPTQTSVPATPTPAFGTGQICVLLFVDANGDARFEDGELPLPDGEVSVIDVDGNVAGETTTDDTPEGHCFAEIRNGDYNVSAAVPVGYNPTTAMNVPVRLNPGDVQYVEFGAQASAALGGGGQDGGQRSPLLGVLGLALLLVAGGLGYLASRYGKGTPKSLR
jgi:hypothetical protein